MLTLFLMTEKGYAVLKGIIEENLQGLVDFVVVGEDKNIQDDYSLEIRKLCRNYDIKNFSRREQFSITSAYSIAVSWRWMIKLNDSKLIVLHDSILPKYRGFAPLVNMLIKGEEKIGVTALFASDFYDEGDIIAFGSVKVEHPIRINEAIKKVGKIYIQLVIEILHQLKNGTKLIATPQNHEDATYSLWRDENDYFIDWDQDVHTILRTIYALGTPYMGAAAYLNGEKIRIIDAEIIPELKVENRDVGKVIMIRDGQPVVVCGSGLLMIKEAHYDSSTRDVIPLQKFRSRFTSIRN
ncbi:MAG: formyltransferase family protein [Flavobacteriales bacterium]|jgi:methionyl-tRNA formyltransferase|nr:formyltransferase family protein [Flavobacteriales bacterium]